MAFKYPHLEPDTAELYIKLREKFYELEKMGTAVQRAYQEAYDIGQSLKSSESFFNDVVLLWKKNRLLKKYNKLKKKYESRHTIFKRMQELTDPKFSESVKGASFRPVMPEIRMRSQNLRGGF